MTRRVAAVFSTLAVCASLAWTDDEPKSYEIEWRDRPQVGQIVTVIEHETSGMDMTMNGDPFKTTHEVLDATYVVRCDELDAKGRSAKRTVFVKSWKHTKDDETDESISGLRVTIAGKVWALPDGKTAGPFAKKWLDKKFAKGGDDPFSSLYPPRMAVGQTWKPDPKAATEAFAKSVGDVPFDLAGVEMEVKLASVDGAPPDASGKFDVKVHLPIGGKVRGLPPGAVLLPGGAAEIVGDRSGPLATGLLGTSHMDVNMAMDIEVSQDGQKLVFATKAKLVQDRKTVADGEIPEPVPTAAPPAPGVK